ncbi:hypothetical protein D352_00462 [Enterococcus faecium LA4B-2]|nr:hypothetical protein D352_00462 [Enterococcus faecium LA4B-2]
MALPRLLYSSTICSEFKKKRNFFVFLSVMYIRRVKTFCYY